MNVRLKGAVLATGLAAGAFVTVSAPAQAADYQPLVVRYQDGAPVRLSDVARVYDGVEDRFNTGYFNNEPAVLLIVSRQPDANIIRT